MRFRPSPALRLALSVALAAVCWLVSGSAHAAAPQCDERGAITFAPNPTLEEPNASLDVGVGECHGPSLETQAYEHGRAQGTSWTDAGVRALPAGTPVVMAAPVRLVTPPPAESWRPPPGVSSRVERPPRA